MPENKQVQTYNASEFNVTSDYLPKNVTTGDDNNKKITQSATLNNAAQRNTTNVGLFSSVFNGLTWGAKFTGNLFKSLFNKTTSGIGTIWSFTTSPIGWLLKKGNIVADDNKTSPEKEEDGGVVADKDKDEDDNNNSSEDKSEEVVNNTLNASDDNDATLNEDKTTVMINLEDITGDNLDIDPDHITKGGSEEEEDEETIEKKETLNNTSLTDGQILSDASDESKPELGGNTHDNSSCDSDV